ncbi:hypothetical protein BKA81DRAFT_159503 [Phyllosticta paracitricarpa]
MKTSLSALVQKLDTHLQNRVPWKDTLTSGNRVEHEGRNQRTPRESVERTKYQRRISLTPRPREETNNGEAADGSSRGPLCSPQRTYKGRGRRNKITPLPRARKVHPNDLGATWTAPSTRPQLMFEINIPNARLPQIASPCCRNHTGVTLHTVAPLASECTKTRRDSGVGAVSPSQCLDIQNVQLRLPVRIVVIDIVVPAPYRQTLLPTQPPRYTKTLFNNIRASPRNTPTPHQSFIRTNDSSIELEVPLNSPGFSAK